MTSTPRPVAPPHTVGRRASHPTDTLVRATTAAAFAAVIALIAAAPSALAQEEFAGNATHVSPYHEVPERFPQCAPIVAQFDGMTEQLYSLSDERRTSHHPRTDEIDREMLSIENARNPVSQNVLQCVRDGVAANEQARDAAARQERDAKLQGKVEQQNLQGSAEQTTLQGGVDVSHPADPIVLQPRTATLETGTPPAGDTNGDPERAVHGDIVPRGAAGSDGSTRTSTTGTLRASAPPVVAKEVTGKIVPKTGDAGNGRNGTGDPRVDLNVSGAVLLKTLRPPGNVDGGTVSNDFTRSYFFAQGVADGLIDAAEELGGNAGRVGAAVVLIMTGREVEARNLLGIKPGESLYLNSLIKDINAFTASLTSDHKSDGTPVQQSYASGRKLGKIAGSKLLERYMKKIDGLDVPQYLNVPGLPDAIPNPNGPNAPKVGP